MAILLLAIILLAITTCVYMFWITFSFNGQFYNGGAIDSITMYMQENGHIKLLVIMILAIIITLLFIAYAIKDSKRMEMYDDGYSVSFDKKDNLRSRMRIGQFIFLALFMIAIGTTLTRFYTLDRIAPYTMLFERNLMIIGFEFMAVYLIVFIATLIFEYIQDRSTTYH